jgi:hypothetical protein
MLPALVVLSEVNHDKGFDFSGWHSTATWTLILGSVAWTMAAFLKCGHDPTVPTRYGTCLNALMALTGVVLLIYLGLYTNLPAAGYEKEWPLRTHDLNKVGYVVLTLAFFIPPALALMTNMKL